jgi:hypothetical protein
VNRALILRRITLELRRHAPFTLLGSLMGAAIAVAFVAIQAPPALSAGLFWSLHPLHVLLSGMATAGMYDAVGSRGWPSTLAVGFVGAVGIAALSDCVIPFLGEWWLRFPDRGLHLGFIEKWWLVNPLALVGVGLGRALPRTRLPHAGHVLLSTSASLFHILMAAGGELTTTAVLAVPCFLFLAVWVPCCTSDIALPLLFAPGSTSRGVGSASDAHRR